MTAAKSLYRLAGSRPELKQRAAKSLYHLAGAQPAPKQHALDTAATEAVPSHR